MRYRVRPGEGKRIRALRGKVAALLRPDRFVLLKMAESNAILGHVCGTCRFGDDPRSSVLDRDNRAHDLDNLYVVDGSFFPSSAGTNPALTIAANALRVARVISARFDGTAGKEPREAQVGKSKNTAASDIEHPASSTADK
jgi:choline dehydrogenase-like flavoprotein